MLHSLVEFFNGRHVYRMGMVRMIGVDATNSNPNSLASTILYTLPLWWFLLRNEANTKLKKVTLLAVGVLSLGCIVLTGSRTGYVGILIFSFFVFLEFRGFKLILALIVLAAVLAIAWNAMPEDKKERFRTIYDDDAGPANAHESAEGRIQGLIAGYEMFKRRPILGAGPGAKNFIAFRLRYVDDSANQAHNLGGEVLGEFGLSGVLIFGGSILFALFTALSLSGKIKYCQGLSEEEKKYYRRLSLACFQGIILLLWGGVTGHNMYRLQWLLFFGILVLVDHVVVRQDYYNSYSEESS